MSSSPFEHPFVLPLHQVDGAGVMFFGHLFFHLHDAYEAFMAGIGHPLDRMVREGEVQLPIVHSEADYLRPIHHGEALRVALSVEHLGRTAFTLAYQVLDRTRRPRAQARTVHVCITADGQGSIPLPPPLRDALKRGR